MVIGIVDPSNLKRNTGAQLGDSIILSKPLGVGILSAALKKDQLSEKGYQAMLALTTQLNRPGQALAQMPEVHALTDVTGFGLAGHLLELTRGAHLQAVIDWNALPIVEEALELVQQDIFTGASTRNWTSYGDEVSAPNLQNWQRNLLSDPQTSGGLLIACSPTMENAVLSLLKEHGFFQAQKIGSFVAGSGLSVQT